MKKRISHPSLVLLGLLVAVTACGPGQRITNSWIAPDPASNAPYKKIFLMVLSPNKETSFSVEDRLAAVVARRGQEFELASAVFPPNMGISENFTKEDMAAAIRRTGCDGVLVVAQLDVKVVETYTPGVAWSPVGYPHYGSYYNYYNYYYPQIYSPGYYSQDRTYYIETNFYDVEEERHLWLIQSEAYNPASLDSWFDTYIQQLLEELEREALLQDL